VDNITVGLRNGLDAVGKRHSLTPPEIKPWFVDSPARSLIAILTYRVSQEERSIFWEVMISVILSKKSVYAHVSYSERFP
jgi:hypothetical protein